jgi:hypothetical protein
MIDVIVLFIRACKKIWRWLCDEFFPIFTSLIRFVRSPKQLVSQWPEGEIPLGEKVAVFVHADRRGSVHEHVMHYVRSLVDSGFSVVFVTNSGKLKPESMAKLQQACAGVLVRRNVGYDFGAWREGLEQLHLPRPNTTMVVLVNDSVYGPLRPLNEMLDRIDFHEADIWGATECWLRRYHLQSYFLAFNPEVLRSEAWRRFWRKVRPAPSKQWLIRHYEIGLTQALIRAGFRCQAVWPYGRLIEDIDPSLLKPESDSEGSGDAMYDAREKQAKRIMKAAAKNRPMNPTSELWRQLLQDGFPFIKRELLRENPTEVLDVSDWRAVAGQVTTIDLTAIFTDLQRTLRNRAP